MKPAAFDYYAPQTLDEALDLMARYGDEAKVLAGGQSLVPAMNFRLAQPAVLVDLNRIEGLSTIRADDEGLRIGAMARQRAVERSPQVAEHAPLVTEALPSVAHPQIRNRATFGGSIAHADPAAELPAVARTLGARLRLSSVRGERWVEADDFFTGLFETALEVDEILTEVLVPRRPAREGWAFEEVARRHGDYAMVGVAVVVSLGPDGRLTRPAIGLLSVGDGPVRAASAEQVLEDLPATAESFDAAAEAVASALDPPSDLHASSDYRRHLARVLTRRLLGRAVERARL